VQWHDKAAEPPGDARSDIWFTVHLGRLLRELYADRTQPRDRPMQALTWDYWPDSSAVSSSGEWNEPSTELILKEINGYTTADGLPVRSFAELQADGSTACGAWIYSGIYAPDDEHPQGRNRAANRQGDEWVSPGWGFSWPANRRILYNRASADPDGRPWPKEERLATRLTGGRHRGYVFWNADAGRWDGVDVPDFPLTKPPDAAADPQGKGLEAHDGRSPFMMKTDGKGWLFVANGLVDGPLPTHYEPYESPVPNPVYRQHANPLTKVWKVPGNEYVPVGSSDYPHVLSTYRLTEHHLSGTMSRWLPWLAELQPELFVEISPEHARELRIHNTDWVRVSTPRGAIRAKALVTRRVRPFQIAGRTIHYVGLPWHWGYKGISQGDVVNDLSALVGDPNVSIHEAKVFVCRVERSAAPGIA
jgi:formate dehydrogenase major subunit